HEPDPTATRRPVRNPPIRTHPLTNSAQHRELGNTPALPKNTTPPGQIRPSINEGRKLPLAVSQLPEPGTRKAAMAALVRQRATGVREEVAKYLNDEHEVWRKEAQKTFDKLPPE
ncbi:hypothetical protein, partial [Mycobacterium innocens]